MRMEPLLTHVYALSLKESRQIIRDKSAILLGVVLPIILIILFGYGLNFDVRNIRLGVVFEQKGPVATQYVNAFEHNPSFIVSRYSSRIEGLNALKSFEIESLLIEQKTADGSAIQLLIDGIDSSRATMIGNAVTGVMAAVNEAHSMGSAGISVIPRIWLNESAESRWYIVPGLIVIILTMTGTMLTGWVLAREWERGTMEALLATPISPLALLLSKVLPYFVLAMLGWCLCMGAAVCWYEVPIRGSFILIAVSSMLYLIVCLGIGLIISGVTRSQFLSSQMALLLSFLPALLLSGFIFDLRSAPQWAQMIAYALPPVYFMELLKVGFLTGGMHALVMKNVLILSGYAALFMGLASLQCRKRIRK